MLMNVSQSTLLPYWTLARWRVVLTVGKRSSSFPGMRRIGELLMALGVGVGLVLAFLVVGDFGVAGASWLVNVALAKLGFIAAGGLIAGGAVSIRIAKRQEQRRLESRSAP